MIPRPYSLQAGTSNVIRGGEELAGFPRADEGDWGTPRFHKRGSRLRQEHIGAKP
jgi:hypothetical protein